MQGFVSDLYTELCMRNFSTWFDVQGGMQGNVNASMALAIENSSLIICVLSSKYKSSINCNFELKYAISKNKSIAFIIPDPSLLSLLLLNHDWIAECVSKSLVFNIASSNEFGNVNDDGYPCIDALTAACRKVISIVTKFQISIIPMDISEEEFKLTKLLEDSKCALAKQELRDRLSECSRFGAMFEIEKRVGGSGCNMVLCWWEYYCRALGLL